MNEPEKPIDTDLEAPYHSRLSPLKASELRPDLVHPKYRQLLEEEIATFEFAACPSRTDQIVLLKKRYPDIPDRQIGCLFGIHAGIVAKSLRPRKGVGRPPVFSKEESSALISYIKTLYSRKQRATYADLLIYLEDNFELTVPLNTLHKWVARQSELVSGLAEPMESARVCVSFEDISRYYNELEANIQGVPAAFVVNVDESGYQRWVDATNRVVVLPKEALADAQKKNRRLVYQEERSEKRSTLIAAVAANGTCLRPLVVTARKTLDSDLINAGYTCEKVIYVESETGYITAEIFEHWFRTVLIPYFSKVRYDMNMPEQVGYIIMDNCTCHESNECYTQAVRNDLEFVWMPSHASDQVQILDLGIFHVAKLSQQKVSTKILGPDPSEQSYQLLRMLHGYRLATSPDKVIAAFRRAGITIQADEDMVLRCYVTRATAGAVRDPSPDWAVADKPVPPSPKTFKIATLPSGWGPLEQLIVDSVNKQRRQKEEEKSRCLPLPDLPSNVTGTGSPCHESTSPGRRITVPSPPVATSNLARECPWFVEAFWSGNTDPETEVEASKRPKKPPTPKQPAQTKKPPRVAKIRTQGEKLFEAAVKNREEASQGLEETVAREYVRCAVCRHLFNPCNDEAKADFCPECYWPKYQRAPMQLPVGWLPRQCQCPKCSAVVVEPDGTNCVQCNQCNTRFCFQCGVIIDGLDHFRTDLDPSRCPMWIMHRYCTTNREEFREVAGSRDCEKYFEPFPS